MPEPASLEGSTAKEYLDSLVAALRSAYQLGCEQVVETTVFELAALSEHAQAWWAAFGAADEDGSLDLVKFQEETILLGDKLMYFGLKMDDLIELGGKQAQYAASIKSTAANIGNGLLIWAFMGIDPEAGTYDLNTLEEFGFTEDMGELVFDGAAVYDEGLAAQWCG